MLLFKIVTITVLWSCYLFNMSQGLTIREVPAPQEDEVLTTTSSYVTETNYRKSVAKIKETPYRVPEHLQFVRKGFIYEDADDVIHVIDPPKHFEELKKIMQRQQQQQRPLPNLRPIALREFRPKPKIVKTLLQAKHKGEPPLAIKPTAELDMQSEESQHLPLEILASVRKTEKYLRKYKPKLPSVKQRLKTQKIQTVIWEQQQENQQYQQGQEQKLQGIREQSTNRRHFNRKRVKRETSTKKTYENLKGEQLLNHLNNLINNASTYLKQMENFDDYPDSDFESTTLKGEILVKSTKPPLSSETLNEDMVVKILENSVKATNVIMQQLKIQTDLSGIKEKCDYLKVTYPNHIQNLQNQIKCMQNFIKDVTQTQQQEQKRHLQQMEAAQKLAKKYGERFESRKTKDLKHKPFIVAQLAEDYIDNDNDEAAGAKPTPVNSSLIYNDVMTTIRNMLQSQNLQHIDDTTARLQPASWEDYFSETTIVQDKSLETVDFHNLQEYLTSLEAIVTNLPKFNHKSLNLEEIEGGSVAKYYFINPQGTIYSLPQPFQKDQIPTTAPTTIFHQFPDLPIVNAYLRNGTLLPPSSKVVEIL